MSEPLDELTSAMQRLSRLLSSRQVATRIITVAGVDVSQQGMVLLRVLLNEGQQSVAALASLAAMDVGAVSRQVRKLEAAGALRRSNSPDDGRLALLALTAKGRRVAERIKTVTARHMEEALCGWSAAEERTLARLINRLVDDLRVTPVRP